MIKKLAKQLHGSRILILGFGKEGKSTYTILKDIVDPKNLFISDKNPNAFKYLQPDSDINPFFISGENYLDGLEQFDLIVKTPGIQRSVLLERVDENKITSQTDLFLRAFSKQIIGITGTKGKSTTTTLIYQIIAGHTQNVVMVGNIGLPPFNIIGKINNETKIVYELSAQQLDDVNQSPHIGILLNIFEEHLDHYPTMEFYRQAKYRIAKFQGKEDWLIMNGDDSKLEKAVVEMHTKQHILRFSAHHKSGNNVIHLQGDSICLEIGNEASIFNLNERIALKGDHNLNNIMAAIAAAKLLKIPDAIIQSTILNFRGLDHRMEFIGNFGGIEFFNDSIATIPEATIAAIKTLQNVDTIILGGKDRGVDYQGLISYLAGTTVRNYIFMGKAGERMMTGLKPLLKPGMKTFFIEKFEDMASIIRNETSPGRICLLSPAASSYDQFSNFEERGTLFRKIVQNLFKAV